MDAVCMDGWSVCGWMECVWMDGVDGWRVWPRAPLQNEETVRPVDLQRQHKMRARSVALNTSQRTSSPLMI